MNKETVFPEFSADLSGTQTEKEAGFYRRQLDSEPIPITAPDIWADALASHDSEQKSRYDKDALKKAQGLVICSNCSQEYFAVDRKLHRCPPKESAPPSDDPNDVDYIWYNSSTKCGKCGLRYAKIARKCFYCTH